MKDYFDRKMVEVTVKETGKFFQTYLLSVLTHVDFNSLELKKYFTFSGLETYSEDDVIVTELN